MAARIDALRRQAPPPGHDATETQPLLASATREPALIVIGGAGDAGGPEPGAARVMLIGHAGLEMGRHPPREGGDGLVPATWRLSHRRSSGRHARIQRSRNLCVLEDLGSTNGTHCNGAPVRSPVPLGDGDLIFVGGHAAVFRWLSAQDRAWLDQAAQTPFGPFATASPVLAAIEQKLRALAGSEQEILLVGETGVGKEVYAEAIHKASGRAGALVTVNCAALPHELVESELFGYVRGAHSQASAAKRGLIEEAENGTLFLDELGDMPQSAQAKLLRFLQTRELMPLGSTRARTVDVRVVAATSRPGASVLPGGNEASPGLRDDLLGRLGAAAFTLPPLRARREDLGVLLAHLQKHPSGREPRALDPALFLAFCLYPWPRNVRELKKAIETAALLAGDADEIGLAHVPAEIAAMVHKADVRGGLSPVPDAPVGRMLRTDVHRPMFEGAAEGGAPAVTERRRSPRPLPTREELTAALQSCRGNVAEVARLLDRNWKVIKRALDRHQIDADTFRD